MKSSSQPSRIRKLLRLSIWMVLVLLAALALFGWMRIRGSLPILNGELTVTGLVEPVSINRDAKGIPTLTASNEMDLALALGFLHAQDRFFQMDGLRRLPAGELAAVFGPGMIETDHLMRRHQLRKVAQAVYRTASTKHRLIMEAYAAGVNQGLGRMSAPPFEYLLLRTQPEPWKPEDSALVIMAMALDLQDENGNLDKARGEMELSLPKELFKFLTPPGSEWDAPLVGDPLLPGPIPGPEVLDLRAVSKTAFSPQKPRDLDLKPGSNNWAVSGTRTSHGAGMIANDMHLTLRIPHIWYRAQIIFEDSRGKTWSMVGVTLPGVPSIVAGSNGHIAWGFTNSYLDWTDLVRLDPDPADGSRYLSPEGPLVLEQVRYTLQVKGGEPVEGQFEQTIWGPVIGIDSKGRKLVAKWSIHDPNATNFNMLEFALTTSVTDALQVAKRCGLPGQNLVVADTEGHIGWTIAGMIPNRVGFDGSTPTSWSDGRFRWDGWVAPGDYPQVIDPPHGRLWTANSRAFDAEGLAKFGESGFALGARAQQIRERLFEKEHFTEKDFLAIQLDDEARFLERWQKLLLHTLNQDHHENWSALREQVQNWGGKARISSVGYRVVRHFRLKVVEQILSGLTLRTQSISPDFDFNDLPQTEGIVWKLLEERPPHLLPPGNITWDAFLEQTVLDMLSEIQTLSGDISNHTWGKRNTLSMKHPLSSFIPMFGSRLNMPAVELDGDAYMPRVQSPRFGASERMVVAPGHEDKAIFHMPAGQSGHPLSPFFQSDHNAWVTGSPSPLLPGTTIHQLLLRPEIP